MLQPYDYNKDMSLFNYLDAFQRDFFGKLSGAMGSAGFRTDISDRGDHYLLEAELPGFKKEDIHVEVKDDVMTIRAEHKEETEEKRDSYLRRERHYGAYARSFDMSSVDVDGISCDYRDGVLCLNLPKRAEQEPSSRNIPIN